MLTKDNRQPEVVRILESRKRANNKEYREEQQAKAIAKAEQQTQTVHKVSTKQTQPKPKLWTKANGNGWSPFVD